MTEEIVEIHFKRSDSIAIIDSIDKDLLEIKWKCHYRGYVIYSTTRKGKTTNTLIHRIIMGRILGRELLKDEVVDHIDNNPLNNRRSNLRIGTRAQNCCNRKMNSNSTTGYKGVSRIREDRWMARMGLNGKPKTLGYFRTAIEAAKCYNAAALKHYGEFARLNVIPPDQEDQIS